MPYYLTKFKDANSLNPVEFTNARNFQWTDTRNKAGRANFALDLTPASRRIRSGWQVEIWRDGTRVFWGKINKRTVKERKIKLFCMDANGWLERKNLFQRAVVKQEASVEVIEKLDGLQLTTGVILNAQKFVDKTGTSQKWHWEGNNFLAYIVDIGENVRNLATKEVPYFVWIDSDFNVHFRADGKEDFYKNLNIRRLTLQDDITSTYNLITVHGNPVNVIPYDGDFWTEHGSIKSWYGGAVSPTTYIASDTAGADTSMMGLVNIEGTGGAIATTRFGKYFTRSENSFYNMENKQKLTVWVRRRSIALTEIELYFYDDNGYWIRYDWSANPNYDAQPLANTWKKIVFNVSGASNGSGGGGTHDNTKTKYFSLDFVHSSGTGNIINIDGLFFTNNVYQYTAKDQTSIDELGELPRLFLERSYYSNAETQDMAEILLSHFKDAKLTFNGSILGYASLKPNSTIEFIFEGKLYRKSLTSITHYVTIDGSESSQLTIGDFKKADIEKLMDKLAEIHRNYNLLESPYKIA